MANKNEQLIKTKMQRSSCILISLMFKTPPNAGHFWHRNGSIRLDLVETSGSILGRIPAGYANIELRLASASSNSMHLQLLDEEGNCLVGQGCLMNSSCSNETDFCHLLDGMPLSYVSGSFLTVT